MPDESRPPRDSVDLCVLFTGEYAGESISIHTVGQNISQSGFEGRADFVGFQLSSPPVELRTSVRQYQPGELNGEAWFARWPNWVCPLVVLLADD